ncbi:hypothetical protein ABE527_18335 [Brucella sp. TWI432]
MKDHPLLFSAPMVRANLEERKTQTRRIYTPQPEELGDGSCRTNGHQGNTDYMMRDVAPRFFTKIKVGDRLWVREAHALLPRTAYRGSIGTGTIQQVEHPTDGYTAAVFREGFDRSGRPLWRPSIHMPRWASRLTLIVTDVKVERLQDISEADAIAEGIERDTDGWKDYLMPSTQCCGSPIDSYRSLWDHVNGPGAWDKNPWVVAYTYRPIFKNIDHISEVA